MTNLNAGELLIIIVLAVLVIGPNNLPRFAEQLARFVKQAKAFVKQTTGDLQQELGADDLDLSQFDLRQYDPRRIVKEALLDDTPARLSPTSPAAAVPLPQAVMTSPQASESANPPLGAPAATAPAVFQQNPGPLDLAVAFDDEAT